MLSKEKEKLKEYHKLVKQHQELLIHKKSQLAQRKRQLLQQLLWIYPIQESSDKKFTIGGIYLPNSDLLSGWYYILFLKSCIYIVFTVQ